MARSRHCVNGAHLKEGLHALRCPLAADAAALDAATGSFGCGDSDLFCSSGNGLQLIDDPRGHATRQTTHGAGSPGYGAVCLRPSAHERATVQLTPTWPVTGLLDGPAGNHSFIYINTISMVCCGRPSGQGNGLTGVRDPCFPTTFNARPTPPSTPRPPRWPLR